jgi:hypothetical protein
MQEEPVLLWNKGEDGRYSDWALYWDNKGPTSQSDEHEKTSLEVCSEDSLEKAYRGRQRCELVVSEPTKNLNGARGQRKLSKTEEQGNTHKIEDQPKNHVYWTITRKLEDLLNTPFVGRQNSIY